jgi:hypothetical protein
MNFSKLLVSVFLISGSVSAANEITNCHELYDRRENLDAATAALSCFTSARESTRGTDSAAFAENSIYALQATIWLEFHSQKSDLKRLVDLGLEISSDTVATLPLRGIGPYWNAVFRSMACRLVDTGVIPKCFLKHKKEIIGALNRARGLEPALHGFGPARILSILYREMPGIVGGDKKLSRKDIEEALSGAPNDSSNTLESARLFVAVGDPDSARTQLEAFLANDCAKMDAARIPECATDREDAAAILKGL